MAARYLALIISFLPKEVYRLYQVMSEILWIRSGIWYVCAGPGCRVEADRYSKASREDRGEDRRSR
jgi:hypothetical protein